jgi:UPF0716 family protein affecting phage T7 exclusion
VGLVLLLPPTRAVARRVLMRRLGRRPEVRRTRGYDVEGTAREYDEAPRGIER